MALRRPCLTCGTLSDGSHCPAHRRRAWANRSPSSRHLASIHWTKVRELVLIRDRYQCVHCGTVARVQVHHRVPVADGGTENLDNLETRCEDCHRAEHRRLAAFEPE